MLQRLRSKVFDEANILIDYEALAFSPSSQQVLRVMLHSLGTVLGLSCSLPAPDIQWGRQTSCALNFCWINWMRKCISTFSLKWMKWMANMKVSQKVHLGNHLILRSRSEPFLGRSQDNGQSLRDKIFILHPCPGVQGRGSLTQPPQQHHIPLYQGHHMLLCQGCNCWLLMTLILEQISIKHSERCRCIVQQIH